MHYLYHSMKLDDPFKKIAILLIVVSAGLFAAYLITVGSSGT